MTYITGVDISGWNNPNKFQEIAAAQHKFAFIKATEGTTYEYKHLEHFAIARAAGLIVGAYHFARPDGGVNDAINEAKHFTSIYKCQAGDLPPVLDIESNPANLSTVKLVTWIDAYLNEIEQLQSITPIMYTYTSFWKYNLKKTMLFSRFPLWQAHYTSANSPGKLTAWDKWTFWQYTSKGSIPGLKGNFDINRFYGDESQLKLLTLQTVQDCQCTCMCCQHHDQ